MPYRVQIDNTVNCVFVQHYNSYEPDEGSEQLDALLKDPGYNPRTNILRDITQVSLPDYYDLDWFKNSSVAHIHGESLGMNRKVDWVVGNVEDFKKIHQWCAVGRLQLKLADRQPFREINNAMKWHYLCWCLF